MSADLPDNLRASDNDRARVTELLDVAYADGRLTFDEHQQRVDRALAARTFAELTPLTVDLAPHQGMAVPSGSLAPTPYGHPSGVRVDTSHQSPADTAIAIFGGTERAGIHRVPATTNAIALFGGVSFDLSGAVFEARTVSFNIGAVFGGVEITVPPGVRVVNKVVPLFGGVSSKARISDPSAPTIELRGLALFGGVDVKVAGEDDAKAPGDVASS
ncbi:protein of unknown function [Raineyella antarctica]|uniref:DUF1707 domain-containing protein n=1 Tax=Raineyella antarctica TaxID=1577474 RepID=A0A1G6GFY5_9ACTN|nr:DUF1707 domain-containing protein [Raineyella antarctica]SDB80665.1 protein of unknown function [Raineyella antarctica]